MITRGGQAAKLSEHKLSERKQCRLGRLRAGTWDCALRQREHVAGYLLWFGKPYFVSSAGDVLESGTQVLQAERLANQESV